MRAIVLVVLTGCGGGEMADGDAGPGADAPINRTYEVRLTCLGPACSDSAWAASCSTLTWNIDPRDDAFGPDTFQISGCDSGIIATLGTTYLPTDCARMAENALVSATWRVELEGDFCPATSLAGTLTIENYVVGSAPTRWLIEIL